MASSRALSLLSLRQSEQTLSVATSQSSLRVSACGLVQRALQEAESLLRKDGSYPRRRGIPLKAQLSACLSDTAAHAGSDIYFWDSSIQSASPLHDRPGSTPVQRMEVQDVLGTRIEVAPHPFKVTRAFFHKAEESLQSMRYEPFAMSLLESVFVFELFALLRPRCKADRSRDVHLESARERYRAIGRDRICRELSLQGSERTGSKRWC